MECKHCGSEIKVGQRFCYNCAMPVDYDAETQEILEKQQNELEKKKKSTQLKNKSLKILITVFPIFIVCFTFIGVFYDKGNKGFTTEKVTNAVSVIKETQEKIENPSEKEIVRYPINMGESCSSKSYEITLQDVDIVDKTYDRAILYNFKSGEEFVFVKVSLFNTLYEDVVYTSLFQFSGVCDGIEVNQSKSGTLAEGKTFISIDGLNNRRQTKTGYICYSLPEGWEKLELSVNIDNIENEPILIVENPKNRLISDEEIERIIENCGVDDFLYDANLSYVSDSELYGIITDFMHLNCLSKTDIIPSNALNSYIKGQLKN